MRGNLYPAPLFKVIRAADVIAMQMGQPDLTNVPLVENAVEQRLLFFIR